MVNILKKIAYNLCNIKAMKSHYWFLVFNTIMTEKKIFYYCTEIEREIYFQVKEILIHTCNVQIYVNIAQNNV